MGYLGSCLILIGMYFIGRKHRAGFIFGILGEASWLVRGLTTGMNDLIILSGIFVAMHLYNFCKWKRKYPYADKNGDIIWSKAQEQDKSLIYRCKVNKSKK
jgi:hypothetical protein